MKTTNTKYRRLQPGYYYSTTPVQIDGTETHVVLEDEGTRWALRLESFPALTTYHQTKRHARFALAHMIETAGLALAVQ